MGFWEVPTFTKCCFCVSMKRGLIAWACFLIITQIFLMILYASLLSDRNMLLKQWFAPSLCLMVADALFGLVLLIAALRALQGLMKVYFYYGVLSVVVHIILMLVLMGKHVSGQIYFPDATSKAIVWEHVINFGGREILQILLQLYIVLLVKSTISEGGVYSPPPMQQQANRQHV